LKLYYANATDANDVTNSLDFMIVANDADRAMKLWEEIVLEIMERAPEKGELVCMMLVAEDASSLPLAAAGERAIPWNEFPAVWRKN